MNKIVKQYIKQLKPMFPYYGRKERKYIKNLTETLNDICSENNIVTLNQLYSTFGLPNETIANYIQALATKDVINKIRISTLIRFFIFCLLLAISTIQLITGYRLYMEAREITDIFGGDIEVTTEEDGKIIEHYTEKEKIEKGMVPKY